MWSLAPGTCGLFTPQRWPALPGEAPAHTVHFLPMCFAVTLECIWKRTAISLSLSSVQQSRGNILGFTEGNPRHAGECSVFAIVFPVTICQKLLRREDDGYRIWTMCLCHGAKGAGRWAGPSVELSRGRAGQGCGPSSPPGLHTWCVRVSRRLNREYLIKVLENWHL